MNETLTKEDISEYLEKLQYLQRACLGRNGKVQISLIGVDSGKVKVDFDIYRDFEIEQVFSFVEGFTSKTRAKEIYMELLDTLKREGWV
jgi:hypothetical protein